MVQIAFRHEISALFHLNIKTTIAAELIKAKVTIHVTAFVNTTNIYLQHDTAMEVSRPATITKYRSLLIRCLLSV